MQSLILLVHGVYAMLIVETFKCCWVALLGCLLDVTLSTFQMRSVKIIYNYRTFESEYLKGSYAF